MSSARPLAVGVAQFAPTASVETNLAFIDDLVGRGVERGAKVVLFPEYSSFFINPFDASLASNAQDIDGPFVAALVEIATRHDVHVVAGLLEKGSDAARVRNTVVAVDRSGVRARYRKLHLYDAFGQRESDWVEAGEIEDPQTFDVEGVRFALMTCYDLRFPEVSRILADTGAHVVLVAAEWVHGPGKEHHWRTLLHARAIENTLFVAAADHPPPLGVGNSMVVDPSGVEIAAIGAASDIAVAVIDPATVERVRRVNPALQLRRFSVVARD